MPLYVEGADRPWIRTGKEVNLLSSRAKPYQLGFTTDTKKLYIFDTTQNKWIFITSSGGLVPIIIQKDGNLVGQRDTLNFVTGNNATLLVTDDSTEGRVSVSIDVPDATSTTRGVITLTNHLSGTADNPSLVDEVSVQKIRVSKDGSVIGTRPQVNFIEGSNITISVSDNSTDNQVDVTISSTSSSADEKVKADSGDDTPGFLSDKVDDNTIKVDTSTHKTYVVDDSSIQRVEVAKDSVLVGTRKHLNFITGSNTNLDIQDDYANNKVDITISVPDASDSVKGVIQLAGHLSGTADSPTVVDDTSNQRIEVQNDGVSVGTRRTINFIPGNNISYTISDDNTNNRVNITISSSGSGSATDEKVKADLDDPISGFLSDKVDNNTIKVDTTTHVVYVAEDSSIQRIEVAKDGTLVGVRKQLNFITGNNTNLDIQDDITNNKVDVTISVPDASSSIRGVISLSGHLGGTADSPEVLDDTSNQRVNVQNDGTLIGTRKTINFIPGSNVSLAISDDSTNNRVNVTISSSGGVTTDEKVKADSGDPTAGYLSDKVDNSTVKVDTTNHRLYVPSDSSTQRVEVSKDGTLIGTRKRINFINSSSVSVSVSDDVSNNRTNISYTVTDDSSVQKTEFSKDGTLVGTRRQLNIVSHNTTDVTLTDNNTNNRVDMTIATKLDNSGSLTYTTSGIKLKDDENAAAYHCYVVPSSGGSTRQWQPIPLSIEANSATLNVVFNITTTETIIDGGGANPIFQLVLSPGKWFVMVYFEGHIRGNTGSSAGTYQNLLTMYMRTGNPPTNTFVQNMRLNSTTQNANVTLGNSLFNSINKTIILTTAYDGQTQDIRGNIVTGTVIYFTGRYTVSGGATVNLSQLLSTCTLQAARIHII